MGSKPDQWRDCIDISVKLTFTLQLNAHHPKWIPFTLEHEDSTKNIADIQFDSLKKSWTIKEITNQNEIYRHLPNFVSRAPFRLKQISDTKLAKKEATLLKFAGIAFDEADEKLKKHDLYHTAVHPVSVLQDIIDAPDVGALQTVVSSILDGSSSIGVVGASAELLGCMMQELASIDSMF